MPSNIPRGSHLRNRHGQSVRGEHLRRTEQQQQQQQHDQHLDDEQQQYNTTSEAASLYAKWIKHWRLAIRKTVCACCNEVSLGVSASRLVSKCAKCKREPRKWTRDNDILPGEGPEVLINANQQTVACLRLVILLFNWVFISVLWVFLVSFLFRFSFVLVSFSLV